MVWGAERARSETAARQSQGSKTTFWNVVWRCSFLIFLVELAGSSGFLFFVEHDVHLADRAQMVGAVAPADVSVDVDLLGHDPAVH